jgi:hypothetical protein
MSLSKSLKLDLPALAEMIRAKGRGKDTMLAHITPKEAALLKRRGGSGSVNPDTGLPEFENDFDFDIGFGSDNYTPEVQPADIRGTEFTPEQNAMYGYSYDPMQAGQEGFAYAGAPGQQISPTQTAYTPDGVGMSGADIMAYQTANAPGAVTPTGKQDPSTLGKIGDYLSSEKGLGTLARLGLTGALGTYGASTARKAGTQAQAATAEQRAIAQPYTEQGKTLVGAAQRGELTPASQQALAAYKAQQAQGVANRGGVGQQQSDAATAALYSNLLDNQYKYGLQIMQIGDNITLGAIRSGLQLDQQLQQTTNNFYAQLASIAAGGSGYLPVAPSGQPYRG